MNKYHKFSIRFSDQQYLKILELKRKKGCKSIAELINYCVFFNNDETSFDLKSLHDIQRYLDDFLTNFKLLKSSFFYEVDKIGKNKSSDLSLSNKDEVIAFFKDRIDFVTYMNVLNFNVFNRFVLDIIKNGDGEFRENWQRVVKDEMKNSKDSTNRRFKKDG